ncbi:hypothetical protein J6590_079762 [Homalodisca vitripennis]|nr:hypothetical protein J6590_095860 [Homalodisca vitripennis]KAG8275764.1 hypothetical protein J6590_079762 [Homalodisca vitripennis]
MLSVVDIAVEHQHKRQTVDRPGVVANTERRGVTHNQVDVRPRSGTELRDETAVESDTRLPPPPASPAH